MQNSNPIKTIVLYLLIVFASGVLFVNIYNSIVDTTAWGANIPQSIEITRDYYQSVNPGTFFRVFSAINQILALFSLVLFWGEQG